MAGLNRVGDSRKTVNSRAKAAAAAKKKTGSRKNLTGRGAQKADALRSIMNRLRKLEGANAVKRKKAAKK